MAKSKNQKNQSETKEVKEAKKTVKPKDLPKEFTPEEIIKKQEQEVKEIMETLEGKKTAKEVKVVKTDVGSKDGQTKCPKCGATDISLNVKKGLLRCNFCRFEFKPEKVEGLEKDIDNLTGEVMGSGAKDITADAKDVITFKCSSCGATVVVDTNESTQARCHWCRNMLSINEQIPNGAVPDEVLPFAITKEEAEAEIKKFVDARQFFAHPIFKKEFTTTNIMGVYFPYMLVDINSHSKLVGQGEHLVRRYTVGNDEHKETRYDADLYAVEREFDMTVKDLTVESSKDRLDNTQEAKTNNVINAIMPFDTENCVKYDSNYLHGYTSEKRDVNIDDLKPLVEEQAKDIARISANDTLKHYDRGVRWENEDLKVKGQQWKSAYLPVWLYSYLQQKGDKKILHYVAVNARTKETMGSVPINYTLLFIISAIIELFSLVAMMQIETDSGLKYVLVLPGVLFFVIKKSKYRNQTARHHHETETVHELKNMKTKDDYIKREHGLSNSQIRGKNNTRVKGSTNSKTMLEEISKSIIGGGKF